MPGPYDTPVPPQRQADYEAWKRQNAPNDSGQDYDLRGLFMSGDANRDERGHSTDQFKKPNHPTFSQESQYSDLGANRGGQWGTTPQGKGYFLSMPANLRYRSLPELQQYFKEQEPSTTLVPPPAGTERLGLPGPARPPIPSGLQPFRYRATGEQPK